MSIADALRTRQLEARVAALEERVAALEQAVPPSEVPKVPSEVPSAEAVRFARNLAPRAKATDAA